MAFDYDNWDRLTRAGNQSVRKLWAYTDTATALATIEASAFFNTVADNLTVGDTIFLRGSDGNATVDVTAVSPNVTVDPVADNIPAGSITTAMLGNNVVTSAKTATNLIQYASGSIPTAAFKAMSTTPRSILAAPGASQLYIVHNFVLALDWEGVQYTSGGTVQLQYGNAAAAAGPAVCSTVAASVFTSATANTTVRMVPSGGSELEATDLNAGLFLTNASADFATGDSNIAWHIWYSVATIT